MTAGRRPSPLVIGLALAYAVGLGLLVLTPIGWVLNRLTVLLYRIWNYDLGMPVVVQPEQFGVVLNVLLFVPVGVLLALMLSRRVLVVAGLGLVLSAAIEIAQLLGGTRQAEWLDVAANAAGGALGALVVRFRHRGKDTALDVPDASHEQVQGTRATRVQDR